MNAFQTYIQKFIWWCSYTALYVESTLSDPCHIYSRERGRSRWEEREADWHAERKERWQGRDISLGCVIIQGNSYFRKLFLFAECNCFRGWTPTCFFIFEEYEFSQSLRSLSLSLRLADRVIYGNVRPGQPCVGIGCFIRVSHIHWPLLVARLAAESMAAGWLWVTMDLGT